MLDIVKKVIHFVNTVHAPFVTHKRFYFTKVKNILIRNTQWKLVVIQQHVLFENRNVFLIVSQSRSNLNHFVI